MNDGFEKIIKKIWLENIHQLGIKLGGGTFKQNPHYIMWGGGILRQKPHFPKDLMVCCQQWR
ncbi:MAG: hypothetical protein MUP85_02015 [Candidatus Lokiarchaeota archaeon]|nr:hypothetical protein [Candidatus Lokiarchaeota archaeon]